MNDTSSASKLLTLVFTDLVDSTALKTEKGDDAAGELIARHRTSVEALSGESGGRIINWAGDGCFQTFDTASAAVTFALKLQEAHAAESDLPQVRTGVHMGEVTEAPGAGEALRVDGLAVDIASRIQSLALPGQILMSSAVFNSVRQRLKGNEFDSPIAWRAHGAYLFKGFDDPMEVGEVGIEGVAPLEAPTASEKAQRAIAPTEEDTLGWRPAAGLEIPGHAHWVLDRQLGLGGYGEVWLASNVNTHDKHVFKFCFQADRLRGLKREVVLFRLLKETLGDRDDIAHVLDWDLENQPYFIETHYTEGGDLKIWAQEKGGLDKVPLETRLELVAQTATALHAAHGAGVLHKDIKPANILITESSGAPKASLTDFGIGLLTDPEVLKAKGITATGLTKTLAAGKSSSTSGTGMYLAPELHEGKAPSEKSDLYGLGVVLYQMVIGDLNHAMAAGWERDVEDPLLREDIAACVDGNPDHRLATAEELAGRLRELTGRRDARKNASEAATQAEMKRVKQERGRRLLVRGLSLAAVLAVVGTLAALLLQTSARESRATWARQEGLPELKDLIEQEKYLEALTLHEEIAQYIPDDPTLLEYQDQATNTVYINTTPPGAAISYKPYDTPDADWTFLGETPIEGARMPLGYFRWWIKKEGHASRETVAFVERRDIMQGLGLSSEDGEAIFQFHLPKTADVPTGMLHVDAGVFFIGLTGFSPSPTMMPPFFVDRTEVTNAAYKEFIDADGYQDPIYWKQEFVRDGEQVLFEEAVATFSDTTGRPGPATWELGSYPEGEADHPVRGVSWYEAAAYAEFRGKSLPTLYHWSRAAHPFAEIFRPLGPLIGEQSNFGEEGPSPVATHTGIGGSGAFDVAGNVREWCWNEADPGHRYALGGAWNDAPYMYTLPQAQPAWDRLETNGFRCVFYPDGARGPDTYFASRPGLAGIEPLGEPLSDEVYAIYKRRFDYADTPLQPAIEQERTAETAWAVERVSIAAAYNDERFDVRLFFPLQGEPPYKAVLFVPGINSLSSSTFQSVPWEDYEFIPKSGRVLVKPTFAEMYERGRGLGTAKYFDPHQGTEMQTKWAKDLGRTIDYLETREDIDTTDLGFIGFSMGALTAPFLIGVEDRIKVAVLASGGLGFGNPLQAPEVRAVTYVPLVKIPVLIMNGRYDYLFPVEAAQKGLLDGLGTPPEHKRHIVYDAGHAPLPRAEVLRDTLEWLDKYQPLEASGQGPNSD